MPDNSLPPPDFPERDGDDGKKKTSSFDDFVNNDLDFTGLDSSAEKSDPVDRSYLRPLNPFPFPTPKPSEDAPYGNLPNRGVTPPSEDESQPRAGLGGLAGRLGSLFAGGSAAYPRIPPPPLEDPRWVRGVYRVQRDLRIYRSPHRSAPRVVTLPEANRRLDKSLRFIANVSPGWSAVHLVGDQPIIGFVDNSEVLLVARKGLRDVWEDVALIVCLILLILALITNLDHLPFLGGNDEAERITALESQLAERDARIQELQATIEALRVAPAGSPNETDGETRDETGS